MKHYLLFIISSCLLLCSCGNYSEKEIEEDTASGVVLVKNESYFEVVLSSGETIYFSGFDEDDDVTGLSFDEDSIETQISFGTGFFVSEKGQIATNAHVVQSMKTAEEINDQVGNIMEALKELAEEAYNEANEELEEVQELYDYANTSDEVSYEEFYQIRDYKTSLEERIQDIVKFYQAVDEIRPSDSQIYYHNSISIAYNNTFATHESDFQSCVVTKTDEEHDLAIIQLKNKKTPEDRFIFEIPEDDPLETYTLMEKIMGDKNKELYMQSFNLGPALSYTEEGVKSQFNSGSVSQKTADRIMYSIPTLEGSSGSPVVNGKEELVAINYAGVKGTQSFNYGIRVKHLKKLLKDK